MSAAPTTHWSVVLSVKHGTSETATRALDQLCHTYWFPVYSLARALGESPEDAADMTQEFFAFVLRNVAAGADPAKGQFRAWLRGAFKRFRAERHRKLRAGKRGGGALIVSFDAMEAERRYALEPRDDASPDVEFDRRWLVASFDKALDQLQAEFAADQKEDVFDLLKNHLQRGDDKSPYRELAETLGTSEAAVKMQIRRMRHRFAETLLVVVGNTLADPSGAREELRELQRVMAA